MFVVNFVPTKKYGAAEVTQASSRWYFGSVGSQPMPTPTKAIEVAENAIRSQVEHAGELGEYYTLEATPYADEI